MLDYQNAKREKMKELQRLMRELIAEEGDVTLSASELQGALDEAGDGALEGELSLDMGAPEMPEDDLATDDGSLLPEEPEDELERMKRDYFRPRPRNDKRPGTAMMLAKSEVVKPDLESQIKKAMPKKSKRMA
jgi:hypothetical protein